MRNLTKRELIFIFVIIQLVLICGGLLAAYFFGRVTDTTAIVNQISLVSSFTSIILALVAIIYAFFQSYSSSKQNQMLYGTLGKINQKIKELVSLKTDVADLKNDLTTQLASVLGGVTETKVTVENSVPDENKEEINNKLSSIEDRIKDIILQNYMNTNHKKYEYRVHVIKKESVEDQEVYEWIKNLTIKLNDIVRESKVAFGNVIIEKNEFNFKLVFYELDKMMHNELKRIIESIDGEKFKVTKMLFRF